MGRPGTELSFEVNPEAMQIEEQGVCVVQRNLAGDLKKSTLKVSAPMVKVNSSFLSKAQRDQFNSLVGISDTFLSFQTRDDWQQVNDLATVLTSTTLQLSNSSALRLSKILVDTGYPGIITINSVTIPPFTGFGQGNFGADGFGGAGSYSAGTITYNDSTMVVTVQNALPFGFAGIYVTYTYKGWLVNMEKFGHTSKGGWLDRFQYDFQLVGA